MASEKERNFGLSPEDVKELQAEHAETKRVPNPYRTGGYRFTVAALIALGADKAHPLAKVYKAFREAAGDEWFQKWADKQPRNAETGKDAEGRFMQNILTLQRTADYGLRLHQVGTKVLKTKGVVIDLLREGDELLVRLNTNSGEPMKLGRAGAAKPTVAKGGGKRPNGSTAKGKPKRKPNAKRPAKKARK